MTIERALYQGNQGLPGRSLLVGALAVAWGSAPVSSLAAADSLPAVPQDSAAVTVLEGTVFEAFTTRPIEGCHVRVERSVWGPAKVRRGAMTDAHGKFSVGTALGGYVMQVECPGFEGQIRLVTVGPEGRRDLRIRLVPQGRSLADGVRDSLKARGEWPLPLDTALSARLEGAKRIQVLRLTPGEPPQGLRERRPALAGSVVIARNDHVAADDWRALVALLRRDDLYGSARIGSILGVAPDPRHLRPELLVRADGPEGPVEVWLDFRSPGLVVRQPDGPEQVGQLSYRGWEFARFAKGCFPQDSLFRSMRSEPSERFWDPRLVR